MKIDNKGQVPLFAMIIIFFLLAIILIFVFTSDVGYQITVNNTEFQKGEDIVLNYDINNGRVFEEISEVYFAYAIDEIDDYDLDYTRIEIGSISQGDSFSNKVIIKTYNLNEGEYQIWTFIEYWVRGKLERSYLSLDVTIID